jgi:hypothetical protein
MAALRYPDTDNPKVRFLAGRTLTCAADRLKMVICAGGGFGHGGIAKGYDNVNAIDCAFTKLNGGRVSWRMETLGSIILHEYTHFAKLMGAKPARSRGKVDIAYGPFATRGMDPVHALRNSDRYGNSALLVNMGSCLRMLAATVGLPTKCFGRCSALEVTRPRWSRTKKTKIATTQPALLDGARR